MNLRIPWRVKRKAYLFYQYSRSWLSRLRLERNNVINISFLCNYQEHTTGSTVAIACIANRLSKTHNVDAFIKPYSGYTSQFSLSVKQYFSADLIKGSIIFVDIEQNSATIENLLGNDKTVVLTCHAFPLHLHGVPQHKLIKNLTLTSYIHFVSEHQRSTFIHHYPDIDIEDKSFVIPNYTRQSVKESVTSNIGIVGYLNRREKNALLGIQLAQQSNVDSIQCWGSEEIYGIDDPLSFSKLCINGWTDNITKIHNSFDILLSTSQFETFGLVVVEALSAGIPCILSDIPVYRELYSDCKGVAFLSGDNNKDIDTINLLLEHKAILKPDIINFWHERFSNETVESKWYKKITSLKIK
jgi:glycosyltransferase involved in cell wall biosynthesis